VVDIRALRAIPALTQYDEPTAALDVEFERALVGRVGAVTAGVTTLLTSHRLSTVRYADEIAVLECGRIAEKGTHEELLTSGGQYAKLWNLQAAQFDRS
jgi:ATP-binding cassette subfamily B protein